MVLLDNRSPSNPRVHRQNTRPQTIYLAPEEYGYGSFATIAVDGTVYMYALEKGMGEATRTCMLPLLPHPQSKINPRGDFTIEDPGHGQRLNHFLPRAGNIISLPDGEYFPNEASIFYSVYHNSYLLVFLQTDYDYTTERMAYRLKLKYSPTPLGPWSTTKVLYTFPVEVDKVLVTPVPFQTGSGIAGRTVLVSSTRYSVFVTTVRKLKLK
ncbi:hypothetical protein POJ06DRAFT_292793 [Lipomyces tetrasporus]|uniref:Uncharacterized protein n=1 Tax=Lipomyces tetrasporus TaxID=54092 RepID=A0AAD7VQI1_9ASCO|nr:uncharacterized protein POJ06DRAFT_292793 [Lipomyces tetrasporus]KAJ8098138.1 hypothetical protein POJ06DRAFT_292793 [Lipomyces tetrasporus]